MDWLEIIQLRSYSPSDRDKATDAFRRLALPDLKNGLVDITMFGDITLKNDISVFIRWKGMAPEKGKSAVGLHLAAVFSQFGQIYHSAWTPYARFDGTTRRAIRAE